MLFRRDNLINIERKFFILVRSICMTPNHYCSALLKLNPKTGLDHHHHHPPPPQTFLNERKLQGVSELLGNNKAGEISN